MGANLYKYIDKPKSKLEQRVKDILFEKKDKVFFSFCKELRKKKTVRKVSLFRLTLFFVVVVKRGT